MDRAEGDKYDGVVVFGAVAAEYASNLDNDVVELRDSSGETLVEFDDPADVFSDPAAYPATEDDIENFGD